MNPSKTMETPRIRLPRSIDSQMYIRPDFEFRPELIDGDKVTHQSEVLNQNYDDFVFEFWIPDELQRQIDECVDEIENDFNTEVHKIWNSDDSKKLVDGSPDCGRSKRIEHLLTELRSNTVTHGMISRYDKGPEWKSLDTPEPVTGEDGEYYFRIWEDGELVDPNYQWSYEVDEGDQRYVQLQKSLIDSDDTQSPDKICLLHHPTTDWVDLGVWDQDRQINKVFLKQMVDLGTVHICLDCENHVRQIFESQFHIENMSQRGFDTHTLEDLEPYFERLVDGDLDNG